MYNPAQPIFDSAGNLWDEITAVDNLRSGGLGAVIKHTADLGDIDWKVKRIADLTQNRFSLVAMNVIEDFDLDLRTEVEFGSVAGWKCIRVNDTIYREKRGSIVVE